MKFQVIGYTLGILITIVGLAEMVPALIDFKIGHENAKAFFLNGILCVFFGGSLLIANRNEVQQFTPREAFLLTSLSWVLVSVFCAMPLYMADLGLTYVDAFFEAVSGLTTTGSTVLTGLDEASAGVLFWRSLMQWIGGLGVIAFAIILLPYLKVGGMQLFRTEASGHMEKVMPRSAEIVLSLMKVYGGLTAICVLVFMYGGMGFFDAINHAMTTISTGGYSTHDASFGFFDSAFLQYAAVVFMLAGALPFVLYIRFVFQGRFLFFKDEQIRALAILLLFFVGGLTFLLWSSSVYGLEESFRHVLFNIVSVITTTGYATTDYTDWGGFAVLSFLIVTYFGACAGSTSGGVKVMRIVIAMRVVSRQFKTLLYPNGVFVLRYQKRRLDDYTILTVLSFLSLYVGANVILTIGLSFTGLDFETSLSGAATALANVGPGIGAVIGPAGNFSSLSDTAKIMLCAGMIIGRLEILTLLVLFSPIFWKK